MNVTRYGGEFANKKGSKTFIKVSIIIIYREREDMRMNLKITNTEVKLFILIKQKERFPNNDFGEVLKEYLYYYQNVLTNLEEIEYMFLLNHFSNKISKINLLNNLNVSEDKYYSDLRKIIKKVWRVSSGEY